MTKNIHEFEYKSHNVAWRDIRVMRVYTELIIGTKACLKGFKDYSGNLIISE